LTPLQMSCPIRARCPGPSSKRTTLVLATYISVPRVFFGELEVDREQSHPALSSASSRTGFTATLSPRPARCRLLPAVVRPAGDLLDAADEILGQVRGSRFRLTEHALGLACERAVCTQRVEACPGCRKNQPACPAPPFPVAFACTASATSARRSPRSITRSENL
jgi:hypothetical protein